jgi:Zn-dependent M28 family amino/carboxypeptidase
VSPSRFGILATIFWLLQCTIGATAEGVRYTPVPREVVEARLKKYSGNDRQREVTLRQMFADAGCDEQHLSEQPVEGSRLPNVICILPGSSDRLLIVGAHFDHVSKGDGVVDNWSGASLLPSLYQAVRSERHKHSYIFIGFTDEERGEVGSHFYVQQMTKKQVGATDAMVNMDTLGLESTKVWASHSDKRLIGELVFVANQLNLPITGVDVNQIGSTDSEQFAARKIPRITVHSLTQETWNARILHTSKDQISVIRFDDYYKTYKLLAAYIASLDQTLSIHADTSTR